MADEYDDLGHAELDELLEPAGLSKSGNLEEKRTRLREHNRGTLPEAEAEAEEQPVEEGPVQHPAGTGHILTDGQWVLPQVDEGEVE